MNREKLNRINELLEKTSDIEHILCVSKKYLLSSLSKHYWDSDRLFANEKIIELPIEVIKPCLTEYLNKLKAELKELGYEDNV